VTAERASDPKCTSFAEARQIQLYKLRVLCHEMTNKYIRTHISQ
jgi:hypothetical protein